MKYSDLTNTQKRCIDAFVKFRPVLATQSTISRPEIEDIFKQLFDARATGGEKIGYPMWLIKGDKVSRGNYVFPAPELSMVSIPTIQIAQPKPKTSDEDKEFFADLKEYGILETA